MANLKCNECKKEIDMFSVETHTSTGNIGEDKYIFIFCVCPNCQHIIIMMIDNEMTYKIFNDLLNDNKKLENIKLLHGNVSKKRLNNNMKIRLKLQLLRTNLHKHLDGQEYQFTGLNNELLTGIFKLPNL